jgi:hypothetical protein
MAKFSLLESTGEVVVRFVYIGGIDNHHCLLSYHKDKGRPCHVQ